jgi:hypothetical protein
LLLQAVLVELDDYDKALAEVDLTLATFDAVFGRHDPQTAKALHLKGVSVGG